MSPTITKVPLDGYRFGKLTVVRRAPGKTKLKVYECRCDCGNQIKASGSQLRAGLVKSCGKCNTREHNGTATKTNKTIATATASRRPFHRLGH